jgi:osmotically-inducible protein OsmY
MLFLRTRIGAVALFAAAGLVAGAFADHSPPPADQEIALAIAQRFVADPDVRWPAVQVVVQDGIAVLSGTVDNLLARKRAEEIASTVRGVQTLLNRITVKAPSRPAEQIQHDVDTALKSEPALSSSALSVVVKDGVVTVRGTVASQIEKQLALEAVEAVRGVSAVDDEVKVEPPKQRADAEIAQDVSAALYMDGWLDDRRVKTTVENGVVSLRGEIGSAAEKARALSLAWVPGVRGVDGQQLHVAAWMADDMRAKPRPNPTSDELRSAIERALRWDPRVVGSSVQVAITGSVATLSGTVMTAAVKNAAINLAENTRGVSKVIDRLNVQVSTPRPNGDIEGDIQAALARDALLADEAIQVRSAAGLVTLEGQVASERQRKRAGEIASKLKGIASIANGIRVVKSAPTAFEKLPNPAGGYPFTLQTAPAPAAPAAMKGDAEIQHRIEQELKWSSFVPSGAVRVKVEHGVATLIGVVSSEHAIRAAAASAREAGATEVRNNLHIQ